MARTGLSRTQRLAITLLPWWAAAIEAESREWRGKCPCGHDVTHRVATSHRFHHV